MLKPSFLALVFGPRSYPAQWVMFSGLLQQRYQFAAEIYFIYSSAPQGRLSSTCRVWGVDVVKQSHKIASRLGTLFYSHVFIKTQDGWVLSQFLPISPEKSHGIRFAEGLPLLQGPELQEQTELSRPPGPRFQNFPLSAALQPRACETGAISNSPRGVPAGGAARRPRPSGTALSTDPPSLRLLLPGNPLRQEI